MIVADRLGVPIDDDVECSIPTPRSRHLGLDTYGSRSRVGRWQRDLPACEKVLDKARTIAAHQLEVGGGGPRVRRRRVPRQRHAGERDADPGDRRSARSRRTTCPRAWSPTSTAEASYDPSNFTFPFGVHIAVVEVDEETGDVDLVRYIAVDDCGNQINPLIVEGQVHGGIVQGVSAGAVGRGHVRRARAAADPVAGRLPRPVCGRGAQPRARPHPVTPSPSNAMGVKGVGEAGTIAVDPGVINAVVDALSPLGVTSIEMPASPERVWRLRAASGGSPMIPASFDYVRADSADAGDRGARRARRRREDPRRRDVADPADEAAARDADGARRRGPRP